MVPNRVTRLPRTSSELKFIASLTEFSGARDSEILSQTPLEKSAYDFARKSFIEILWLTVISVSGHCLGMFLWLDDAG